jgi:hypothetical protein
METVLLMIVENLEPRPEGINEPQPVAPTVSVWNLDRRRVRLAIISTMIFDRIGSDRRGR